MTMTIELPESVAQELDQRHISNLQVRAFVIEVVEAWLRIQSREQDTDSLNREPRFNQSAVLFAEKIVRENRDLFEQLAKL